MRKGSGRVGLGFVAAIALAGCSATKQAPVSNVGAGGCAFLGATGCSRLRPGAQGEADLRYINPNAVWTQYNKVIIDPVTYWGDESGGPSAADQTMLTNYFYAALVDAWGKKFQIVQQPGPGVMRVQVAITNVTAATPGLRTISTVVPQLHLLNTLQSQVSGQLAFAGSVQAEGRITDSQSGQILSEGVDKRIGGGSIEAAAQWQWGDAENAMKLFAKTSADRVYSWTTGTVTPPPS